MGIVEDILNPSKPLKTLPPLPKSEILTLGDEIKAAQEKEGKAHRTWRRTQSDRSKKMYDKAKLAVADAKIRFDEAVQRSWRKADEDHSRRLSDDRRYY